VILAAAVVAVLFALLVAALERRGGRSIEREFRRHLTAELHGSRIRVAQLEHMIDSKRALELEIPDVAERDGHLLVSAPALTAPGTATSTAAPRGALSIDTLPEPLRSEIRALEGDDVQREYLETVQNELANGADPIELHSRLFG
jgi:hypothetical protein